jgi:hypothetical protein
MKRVCILYTYRSNRLIFVAAWSFSLPPGQAAAAAASESELAWLLLLAKAGGSWEMQGPIRLNLLNQWKSWISGHVTTYVKVLLYCCRQHGSSSQPPSSRDFLILYIRSIEKLSYYILVYTATTKKLVI